MSEPSPIEVGAFDLQTQLARGGMGEVWRAVHRGLRTPVAVKVLTSDRAFERRNIEAFHAEVRAMAALSHPGIVVVHDHGVVSGEAARASVGLIVEGSPYVAMELLHGPLGTHCGRLTWDEVASVARQVLRALAHAHARGVIHRDVKPSNLLVAGGERPHIEVKIADFGIAYLRPDEEANGSYRPSSGTAGYAPPEQIAGAFRDYGPWTDLYALGRTVRRLTWGPSDDPSEGSRPPDGFLAWISRMTMPAIEDRFPCAADALSALEAIAFPSEPTVPGPTWSEMAFESTHILRMNFDGEETRRTKLSCDTATRPLWPERLSGVAERTVPSDWGDEPSVERSGMLWDTGLSLYALRAIPFVGRVRARARLWKALRLAAETGKPQFRLVVGAAGVGKSRLAEWLCERAHEIGAAIPLVVRHSEAGGPADGFAPMVARTLGVSGLDDVEAGFRVNARLFRLGIDDPLEVAATVALADVEPAKARPEDVPFVRFERPSERHTTLLRFIEKLSRERPIVLWLDDIQWGHDALVFCQRLASSSARIAVVMTARAEERAVCKAEFALLDELAATLRGRFATVDVPPLERASRRALVRSLLGLEGAVATQVEERTVGNPLFAVQLVGDWVARGLLVRGKDGFALRRGAKPELPESLQEVCRSHLDRLLEGRNDADVRAMEAAAVLGMEVDDREWAAVCAELGVAIPADLVETLLSRRLATRRPREAGFAFIHAMLQESLVLRAEQRGTAKRIHAACADVLARRNASPERVARHRIGAEDWEGAIAPLEEAFLEQYRAGQPARAEQVLEIRREVTGRLEGHGSRGRFLLEGDALLLSEDRGVDVSEALDGLIARAVALGEERTALKVLFRRPNFEALWSDAGRQRIARARDLEHAGTTPQRIQLAVTESWAAMSAGDMSLAEIRCREALALWGVEETQRFPEAAVLRGNLLNLLADIARLRGDLDAMTEALDELERVVPSGNREMKALLAHTRGNLLRARGEFEEAVRAHETALRLFDSMGRASHVALEHCELVVVAIAKGDWLDAAERLGTPNTAVAVPGYRELLEACIRLGLGQTGSAATLLTASIDRTAGIFDTDFAWLFERFGDLVPPDADRSLATRAWQASLAQWERFGRVAEVERVRAKLAAEERAVPARSYIPG